MRYAASPIACAWSESAAATSALCGGSGSGGGGGGGSGPGSGKSLQRSADPIAIVACPSAIAWWIRQISAVLSPSSGSTTSIAQSGRSRGRRSAISRATISRRCASSTGPSTGTARTWRAGSKSGSSAQTGAARLEGNRRDALPAAWGEADPARDPVAQVGDGVAGALGDQHLAGVADDRARLEREDA